MYSNKLCLWYCLTLSTDINFVPLVVHSEIHYILSEFGLPLLKKKKNNFVQIHTCTSFLTIWKNMLLVLKTVIGFCLVIIKAYCRKIMIHWYFILRQIQCDHTLYTHSEFLWINKTKENGHLFFLLNSPFSFILIYNSWPINMSDVFFFINWYFGQMNVTLLEHAHFMIEDWNNDCFILTVSQSYFTDEWI